ncbi:MAG: ribosome recycling factor [Candidatus Humimicrobiia bacterium]
MIDDVLIDAEHRMKGAIKTIKQEFSTVRTGRASVSLLDKVTIDYYGVETPLNQLASLSAPDPRLIVISPYDPTILEDIEKAIYQSKLGLAPFNDGKIIKLGVPELTEERRKDLVKLVKEYSEEGKMAIRNVRKKTKEALKKHEEDREITEDQHYKALDKLQELTEYYNEKIEELLGKKEKDIMEI